MSLDVIAIGTHGHLRTTADIELLAVGSWGKFPKLGPTEFVVGVQVVTLRSAIFITFDVESHVFRTHRVYGPVFDQLELESFIQATWRFISGMLPPTVDSHIQATFRRLSRMIRGERESEIDKTTRH